VIRNIWYYHSGAETYRSYGKAVRHTDFGMRDILLSTSISLVLEPSDQIGHLDISGLNLFTCWSIIRRTLVEDRSGLGDVPQYSTTNDPSGSMVFPEVILHAAGLRLHASATRIILRSALWPGDTIHRSLSLSAQSRHSGRLNGLPSAERSRK
jgi:hypothetical protein